MIAREIITRAHAEVVQSKYEISDGELSDGLRYLNRMMSRLEAQGVDVNYTELSSVDDQLTTPMTVNMGMVKNLAVSLWPQYNTKPLNPAIKFWADKSLETMRSQAIDGLSVALFPSTLPIGSGNYQDTGYIQNNFYTNQRGQSYYIAQEDNND